MIFIEVLKTQDVASAQTTAKKTKTGTSQTLDKTKEGMEYLGSGIK